MTSVEKSTSVSSDLYLSMNNAVIVAQCGSPGCAARRHRGRTRVPGSPALGSQWVARRIRNAAFGVAVLSPLSAGGALQAEIAGVGEEASIQRDAHQLDPGTGMESVLLHFDEPKPSAPSPARPEVLRQMEFPALPVRRGDTDRNLPHQITRPAPTGQGTARPTAANIRICRASRGRSVAVAV